MKKILSTIFLLFFMIPFTACEDKTAAHEFLAKIMDLQFFLSNVANFSECQEKMNIFVYKLSKDILTDPEDVPVTASAYYDSFPESYLTEIVEIRNDYSISAIRTLIDFFTFLEEISDGTILPSPNTIEKLKIFANREKEYLEEYYNRMTTEQPSPEPPTKPSTTRTTPTKKAVSSTRATTTSNPASYQWKPVIKSKLKSEAFPFGKNLYVGGGTFKGFSGPAKINAKGQCTLFPAGKIQIASNCVYLPAKLGSFKWVPFVNGVTNPEVPDAVQFSGQTIGRFTNKNGVYLGTVRNGILFYAVDNKELQAQKYQVLTYQKP